MKILNAQKIQLPNGTLLTIEGGDAASTAQIIVNRLGLNQPTEVTEPPLLPPVLNFAPPSGKEPEKIVINPGEEPPLIMPKLTFSRT